MKGCKVFLGLALTLAGCSSKEPLVSEFLTGVCIKPYIAYRYHTCSEILFSVDGEMFSIPANFETDLASIPKFAWSIMAPAHSSLIRPAIVHDWFYRKTCDFNRHETDLIFYYMLKNNNISTFRASIMYYAVRLFGWKYYNEDYCHVESKGMDKEMRRLQFSALSRHG